MSAITSDPPSEPSPHNATGSASIPAGDVPEVEIVLPVHNEAATLAASIERLHGFLEAEFPFTWRITIADNGSTDDTPLIAHRLAGTLPGVHALTLEQVGRGRALRAAWSASDAQVAAYMDIDLSTDLRGLAPMVAAVLSGHSEVAIGSRLARGAQVRRGPRRELISRAYNLLLRTALRARFSDAQCGFKAVRADVLQELLEAVDNDHWFFDTELLMAAQWRGMRIHEVPVDWIDDPDSRVRIVPTALEDLRGVVRLLARRPMTRFLAIGVASTISYMALYVTLAGALGATAANAFALTLTTVANTAANRRFTFGVRGRAGMLRDQLGGFGVFLFALALTTATIDLVHTLDPHPSRTLEALALVFANLGATLTRYLALSSWVFARRERPGAPGRLASLRAASRS